MNILVLNCGSSSIKFMLFQLPEKVVLAKGIIEKIGEAQPAIHYKRQDGVSKDDVLSIQNHEDALRVIFDYLTHSDGGVMKTVDEIDAVGHRVVHGGEEIQDSSLIDDRFIEVVERLNVLAPLHNPHNLTGIKICRSLLPKTPNVGVFDTAFHSSLPDYAYMYALPYEWYENYMVRRYGFHGTSHKYVSKRAAECIGQPIEKLKIITCHLGNGCSITAVKHGKSVDTSMGLTPMEGLIMGTRCGDMDPAIVAYMANHQDSNMSFGEIDKAMNKKSGLLGISGVSNDMRELMAVKDTNPRADLALKMTAYRLKKYIGSYAAAMDGVDCIVFTGGIGENSDYMREHSISGLEFMGVKLDLGKNFKLPSKECAIHTSDSRAQIWVIPTNEELVIAEDTYKIVKNK